MSLLIHFFLGLVISFVGSLPPGVINMQVMHTTLRKSFRTGMAVAAGASFFEFFQSYIAIFFSKLLLSDNDLYAILQYSIIPVFLILGLFYLLKGKAKEDQIKNVNEGGSFFKGMLAASLNIFVIPFWIFWTAYFAAMNWLQFSFTSIFIFSVGVAVGTMLALAMYGKIGLSMAKNKWMVRLWSDRSLGVIFLLIGAFHAVKYFPRILKIFP